MSERDRYEHAEAISAVLKAGLWEQIGDLPDRYMDWIDVNALACEVVASVAIPDRSFRDDRGRRWEWCGGEEGTWEWRITAWPKGDGS